MRFDVYQMPGRPGTYAIDVQTDFLSYLATTVVIPVVAKPPEQRIDALHPVVRIEDKDFMLATHQLFSIKKRDLKNPIASLAVHRDEITRALDLLLTGF